MGDADDTSEAKTEVAVNPYMYVCSEGCEKRRKTRCIPQEMFFHIFLHLPAKVLHDVMRHVCREWNLMIHSQAFIYHHLRNSTPGIMIQDWCSFHNAIYLEMRRGCLEICKFGGRFEDLVLTSCNGLALAPNYFGDRHSLYVINPLTKQRIILPRFFHQIEYGMDFVLAFVEASMEYKVVHTCGNEPFRPRTKITVLTIGVDKVWRHIDIEHLSLTTKGALTSSPLVTGAYIHWTGETFVLTLNVQTETIHWFPMPQFPKIRGQFLPMGSNLSFVQLTNEFFMDVWEINSETGEWTLLLNFDLKPLNYRFNDSFCKYTEPIIPFGWLVVREVLVFSTTRFQRRCITYNIKTREIVSFELDNNKISRHFQPHVNSLVQLEGEF